MKLINVFRNVVFLGWLSFALASATIAATVSAVQMGATVAALTTKAASTAVAHRKQVAQAVAKAKAKARLQRLMAALPFVGLGAIFYFEEQDFQDWKEQNPDGTRQQYACEVASLTAEVMDDVLASLPERVRPHPDEILNYMPECR